MQERDGKLALAARKEKDIETEKFVLATQNQARVPFSTRDRPNMRAALDQAVSQGRGGPGAVPERETCSGRSCVADRLVSWS